MIRSQWTSYLSSVLSASEMAGFLTAVLHAWLLLEEKGTILIQNSTLRTSLHNICIKRLITTSQWFYYATKYNINEFVRGKQGMWSNVLLSFCSTNTSLLHLTSCQPWSFEYVVLGQIWINAQRSWRAKCTAAEEAAVRPPWAQFCCVGWWDNGTNTLNPPGRGLKEETHGGQAVFEEQNTATLRLSEHKSRRKPREMAGVQDIKTRGDSRYENDTQKNCAFLILLWCLY